MKCKIIIPSFLLAICCWGCSADDDTSNLSLPEDYGSVSYPYLYLEEGKSLSVEGSGETVRAVHTDRGLLYVTNKAAREVEVYSLADLSKQNISYGNAELDCCGGYACDSLVFVTSTNNPCQVSVFHRSTGAYICRLGDGTWWGPLVHPYSVAVNSKYVFVWNQGAPAVKVFNRAQIKQGASLQTWASLDTENIEGYNNQYSSLTVDGDTCLYVLSGDRGNSMFVYNLSNEISKGEKLKFDRKSLLANGQSYGLAFGNQYVYASVVRNGSNQLLMFNRKEFVANPDLNSPLFSYDKLPDGTLFKFNRNIAAKGDTIYLPQNQNKIYELIVCSVPIDVITPINKMN